MENNKTHDDSGNRKENASSASADAKRRKQNNKSKPAAKKTDTEKKKSFRRSWRSASPITRLTIIFLGLAAIGTLAYAGVTVWQTLEARRSSHAQHMPLVINFPPELLQPFVCYPNEAAIRFGNMQMHIKNIGSASALHVAPYYFDRRAVPDKKTGDAFTDSLPPIDCGAKMDMKQLEFPLAPGVEVFPQIRQSVMSVPNFQKESAYQLYEADCVYYADEYDGRHGTCDIYRLSFVSSNPLDLLSGDPSFYCDTVPRIGKFIGNITGHCQQ